MKKRLLSFVLLIGILSSLFMAFPVTAGAAEGTMPVSFEEVYCYYTGGTVTAKITLDSSEKDGLIYLAIYNDGQLVGSGHEVLTAGEVKKTIEIAGADESYIGYEAKVICWGEFHLLTPIAEAFETVVEPYESEMIRRLKAVSAETAPFIDKNNTESYSVFNSAERYILKNVKICIDDAIANHADEIDGDFVKNYYKDEIADVKAVYDEMRDNGTDDAFIGRLAANYTTENLIWLADTLGVDLEKYGIDSSKYR